MSSRWVCENCGMWCELLTEDNDAPRACPYNRSGGYPAWERIDEEEEDE